MNWLYGLIGGVWQTREGRAQIEEWDEDRSPWSKFSGIDYFDSLKRVNIAAESLRGEMQLGAMVDFSKPRKGNPYEGETDETEYYLPEASWSPTVEERAYTTKDYSSLLTAIMNNAGPNLEAQAADQLSDLGKQWYALHNHEQVIQYQNLTGDDINATDKTRDAFLASHKYADAYEFLFGSRTTIHSPEAYELIEEIMRIARIPELAVPWIQDTNYEDMKYQHLWKPELQAYDLVNSTYEGREQYVTDHPEWAIAHYQNRARLESVPDQWTALWADYKLRSVYPSLSKIQYADEWLLMDNPEFYEWMLKTEQITQPLNFWMYPKSPQMCIDLGINDEYKLKTFYENLPEGNARLYARCKDEQLDKLMVRLPGGPEKLAYQTAACAACMKDPQATAAYNDATGYLSGSVYDREKEAPSMFEDFY